MKKNRIGVLGSACMHHTGTLKIAALLLFLIYVTVQGLRAHTTLGSAAVSGTVTNPSGGFIPAA
jgi:hypothetical protein